MKWVLGLVGAAGVALCVWGGMLLRPLNPKKNCEKAADMCGSNKECYKNYDVTAELCLVILPKRRLFSTILQMKQDVKNVVMLQYRRGEATPDLMLQDLFDYMDQDHSGKIDFSEFEFIQTNFGDDDTTPEHNQKEFAEADTDNDGLITQEEFIAVIKKGHEKKDKKKPTEKNILLLFKIYDKDEDGFFSVEEFKNFMTATGNPLSLEMASQILATMGGKDGFLSFDAFFAAMSK